MCPCTPISGTQNPGSQACRGSVSRFFRDNHSPTLFPIREIDAIIGPLSRLVAAPIWSLDASDFLHSRCARRRARRRRALFRGRGAQPGRRKSTCPITRGVVARQVCYLRPGDGRTSIRDHGRGTLFTVGRPPAAHRENIEGPHGRVGQASAVSVIAQLDGAPRPSERQPEKSRLNKTQNPLRSHE